MTRNESEERRDIEIRMIERERERKECGITRFSRDFSCDCFYFRLVALVQSVCEKRQNKIKQDKEKTKKKNKKKKGNEITNVKKKKEKKNNKCNDNTLTTYACRTIEIHCTTQATKARARTSFA